MNAGLVLISFLLLASLGCISAPRVGCAYGNSECGSDQDCVDNVCVPKSGCAYNNPECGSDQDCVDNACVLKTGCAYSNPSCPPDYDCANNTCMLRSGCAYGNPPCDGGETCVDNICVIGKECRQTKTFNMLVFMDDDSYDVSDGEIEEYFEEAGKLLHDRTCTEIEVIKIWHVRLGGSGGMEQALRDKFTENAALARRANGFVFFSADQNSRSYGGYAWALMPASLGLSNYCNNFSYNREIHFMYGSVIDWTHMFGRCGYDEDLNHVSDVSIDGECRNQQGTSCVFNNGYYMCESLVDDYYATNRNFFTATTIIHEIMHHFGDNGNYDHFGTQECLAHGDYERDFYCPSQEDSDCYFQMCPYVYGNFENAENLCG